MTTDFPDDPISRIEWREAENLTANGYNPNVVMNQELQLLEFSILSSGWVQPILVNRDGIVIDGFHRAHLAKTSRQLREKYGGKVPCVVMDIDEPSAMLLTVRINRAKGSHVAFKMHELVTLLIDKHAVDPQRIAQEMGATQGEVDLLYQANVFKVKNTQAHEYSRAWEPKSS